MKNKRLLSNLLLNSAKRLLPVSSLSVNLCAKKLNTRHTKKRSKLCVRQSKEPPTTSRNNAILLSSNLMRKESVRVLTKQELRWKMRSALPSSLKQNSTSLLFKPHLNAVKNKVLLNFVQNLVIQISLQSNKPRLRPKSIHSHNALPPYQQTKKRSKQPKSNFPMTAGLPFGSVIVFLKKINNSLKIFLTLLSLLPMINSLRVSRIS
mmetsp:Transcript_18665/g.27803  ORF Transcript_18665/g.27803 Transcript_18665/m.27803 type:complete len:207 (-) Transcript_18665:296-916(-)